MSKNLAPYFNQSCCLVQRFAERYCIVCSTHCVQKLFDDDLEDCDDNLPAKIITTEEALLQILDVSEGVYESLPRNKYRPDYWAMLCNACTESVDSYLEIKIANAEQGETVKAQLKVLTWSTTVRTQTDYQTWWLLKNELIDGLFTPEAVKELMHDVNEPFMDNLGMILKALDESLKISTPGSGAANDDDDDHDHHGHATIVTNHGEQKLELCCIFCSSISEVDQFFENTASTEANLTDLLDIKDVILDKIRSVPQFGREYWASLCCATCDSSVRRYSEMKARGSKYMKYRKISMKSIIYKSVKEKVMGSDCPIWKQVREDALIGFQGILDGVLK